MLRPIDATHDPGLRSWVDSANHPDTDFPIQNLPFGLFRTASSPASGRIGVAIGDQILDVAACCRAGLLSALPDQLRAACAATSLNPLMALAAEVRSSLRHRLSQLLQAGQPPLTSPLLVPMAAAELLLPVQIGDYTDFYASMFHATNVGKLFRPDAPLLPNYKHVPIAYHGRASSIVVSGTAIRRPLGQRQRPEEPLPQFGPSQGLDYELEVGGVIGLGNPLGEPIDLDRAEEHLFGLCLVNDWSARDIQAWEYQPLGPFLAKSFATTVSPWIVTLEALAPYRCPAFGRAAADPSPLPYLDSPQNTSTGGLDLTVEAWMQTAQMQQQGLAPYRLSRASFAQMYWTLAQMLTHHASNGCNLRTGDLLASGTVSGAEAGSQGCLLEITQRGAQPIELPSGELRSFLADGDTIELRGYCQRQGFARIGFGACQGTVLPAKI